MAFLSVVKRGPLLLLLLLLLLLVLLHASSRGSLRWEAGGPRCKRVCLLLLQQQHVLLLLLLMLLMLFSPSTGRCSAGIQLALQRGAPPSQPRVKMLQGPLLLLHFFCIVASDQAACISPPS